MLFTTAVFVFLYLPTVLAGFFAIARYSPAWAARWLFAASVFFYGYWMPAYTGLLLASIVFNFVVGVRIASARTAGNAGSARAWVTLGVVADLALLGYYKYFNFALLNLSALLELDIAIDPVVLPIGISFFTFTQIAFLVDAYQHGLKEYRFSHYGLFVSYFPHLVAGPVLHHAQMMPQFAKPETYRPDTANIHAGLAIFCLGLLKKVVLADGISQFADPIFDAVDGGAVPTSAEAWLAALAYTFQLYFDFSGYSDMAIGLSWMFNVRLPYNFDSPYKAQNISDFWRRWHMSLSAFLRDYLYIPLGGNRSGKFRRYLNLAVTMLLGGLWHGANWTFVVWGGLHGIYLCVHHAYRALIGNSPAAQSRAAQAGHRIITFLAVVVAWVFFRAGSFTSAWTMLDAMAQFDFHVQAGAPFRLWWNEGLDPARGWLWCLLLGITTWFAPNSNRIGEALLRRCRDGLSMRHFIGGMALTWIVVLVLINGLRSSVSSFIYFNF